MYYFACLNVPEHITGVDRAYLSRLNLFKSNNIPAKIITIEYNHMAYDTLVKYGVEYDTINMYDYFQNAVNLKPSKPFNIQRYWEESLNYKLEVVSHQLDIIIRNQDNQFIQYARFTTTERKKLDFVNHISDNGTIVKHEQYDHRGFLSSVQYYGPHEKCYLHQFYNVQGDIVLEKYYQIENQHLPIMILLHKSNGSTVRFKNEDELISYFIESIYSAGDIFIIDRPYEYIIPFANTHPYITAAVFMHTTHLADEYSEGRMFKWPFNFLGDHLNRFKALICSTEAQCNDLSYDQFTGQAFNIPVGFIEDNQLMTTNQFNHKNKFKIISVARYISSKQLDHQIRLVHRLKKEFPLVSLDIYGFGGLGGVEEELKQLINDLNANDYIHLKGYSNNLDSAYQNSGLFLLTSKEEGFALVLLESYKHNTPVISYDIKYGPNEIIQDNVNGNLVPLDDEEQLYKVVHNFLSDDSVSNRYYENCILTQKKYSASQNFDHWMKLIQYLEHKEKHDDINN